MRALRLLAFGIIVIIIILIKGYLKSEFRHESEASYSQAGLAVDLMDQAKRYQAAGSDAGQQHTILEQRKHSLCEVHAGDVAPKESSALAYGIYEIVDEWVGRVRKVNVESDGASLGIDIGFDVWLENHGSSNQIDAGTGLFDVVKTLHEGDKVKFSGMFIVKDGCATERSQPQDDRMKFPRLIFRFYEVCSMAEAGATPRCGRDE